MLRKSIADFNHYRQETNNAPLDLKKASLGGLNFINDPTKRTYSGLIDRIKSAFAKNQTVEKGANFYKVNLTFADMTRANLK